MSVPEFSGADRMVEVLDEAVRHAGVEATTAAVKQGLEDLVRTSSMDLPDDLCAPNPESYARRLVYRSPELGYTVVAMTWGPGQSTPLHDHAGIWCVEVVCHGDLEVAQFELLEHNGETYRFERQEVVQAGVGSAGRLIPPFEYHTLSNRSHDSTSVTLHVYGGEMDHCSIFHPLENGWYQRESRQLAYSA